MSVFRCYSEKKPGYDVEAQGLWNQLREQLGIEALEKVRQHQAELRTRSPKPFRQSLRILRGNPSAVAREFQEALDSLRHLDDK